MGNPPESSPKKPKGDAAAAMGYPTAHNQSQQMYPAPPPPPAPPGHPIGYPPYPPPNPYAPPPYQPYPYPQPYNDAYNCQQHPHSKHHLIHEADCRGASSFARVLLILMFCAIFSMLMMSMIIWLFFGASVPDFEVASVAVSNFTVTNTSLSGFWSIGMWISNVNVKVDVDFVHGTSSIFYKNSMLGITAIEPFAVRKTQRFWMNYTVPALRMTNDQKLQSWVLPTLEEDRSRGAVTFSLGMAVDANFTAPDAAYRQESLQILCEDLEIRFPSPSSGEGAWSAGLESACFIRLRDYHDQD